MKFTLSASMLLSAFALLGTSSAAPVELESRALPTPVDVATAKTYLASLTIAPEVNDPPYRREYFHHWITISGKCKTRETVLKRDATNIVTNSDCTAQSGDWFSVYDNDPLSFTTPVPIQDGVQIDHMVPLSEAWKSGASQWTPEQREAFANDLIRPQLIAVSGHSNQSKGDKDPAEWLPVPEYQCTYVRAWVTVKQYYNLSVDQAEHDKIASILDTC